MSVFESVLADLTPNENEDDCSVPIEAEDLANANLRLAASDMLAALKWFVEFCDEHEDWTTNSLCNGRDDSTEAIWLQSARAAIAKATGGTAPAPAPAPAVTVAECLAALRDIVAASDADDHGSLMNAIQDGSRPDYQGGGSRVMRIDPAKTFELSYRQGKRDGNDYIDWIFTDRSKKGNCRNWWLTLDQESGKYSGTFVRAVSVDDAFEGEYIKLPAAMVAALRTLI